MVKLGLIGSIARSGGVKERPRSGLLMFNQTFRPLSYKFVPFSLWWSLIDGQGFAGHKNA
jgi:hypothetical protein